MDPADASPLPDSSPAAGEAIAGEESDSPIAGSPAHNFAVQKERHRQIRNDPDYDDWEYGTEPLPQEAWRLSAQPQPGSDPRPATSAG